MSKHPKNTSKSPVTSHTLKLTASKAEKKFGIARKTLNYLAASGQIPHYRLGQRIVLFDEADILAILEKNRHEPA